VLDQILSDQNVSCKSYFFEGPNSPGDKINHPHIHRNVGYTVGVNKFDGNEDKDSQAPSGR
jgi:hypothetical protein